MSSASPTELSAALLIERIDGGGYPREVVLTIARGFLPLPQEELIAVLAYLRNSTDAEIAELAGGSLSEVPVRAIMAFAANEQAPPQYLAALTHAVRDAPVLEALVRNRSVPDDAIVELATRADAAAQEVIVINQARILRAPEILGALLANPNLTPDVRRRALETREEFFEKKARMEAQQAAEAVVEEDVVEIADLLVRAVSEDQAGQAAQQSIPELTELERKDPENQSIFARILMMSVAEKVKLAFKTDKTGRMILVRDRNKLVCSAVMRNPRMNDSEAEQIAGMRNVDEEVLRLVSTRRQWMSKYPIVLALARNPKAPVGVVLPLINRLTLRDLKFLKDDKSVSEVVRATAKKLYLQRSQKS